MPGQQQQQNAMINSFLLKYFIENESKKTDTGALNNQPLTNLLSSLINTQTEGLSMPQNVQIPTEIEIKAPFEPKIESGQRPKSAKVNKNCPHKDRKHYAKGMCSI